MATTNVGWDKSQNVCQLSYCDHKAIVVSSDEIAAYRRIFDILHYLNPCLLFVDSTR